MKDIIDNLAFDDATIVAATAASSAYRRPSRCRGVVVEEVIDDAPTGTSPTLNITLQASRDGTNWYDVSSTGTKNAAGSARLSEHVPAEEYWRVKPTIGGSNTPSFTGVHIHLLFLREFY